MYLVILQKLILNVFLFFFIKRLELSFLSGTHSSKMINAMYDDVSCTVCPLQGGGV